MIKTIDFSETGFTLLEVLIALSIFTIGILAVGAMQISAIRGNDTSSDFTEALLLGQSKLDGLAFLPFLDTQLNDSDNDGVAGIDDGRRLPNGTILNPGGEDGIDNVGKFTLRWNIADITIPPAVNNNAKRVKIFIQWQQSGKTIPSQIELESLILAVKVL